MTKFQIWKKRRQLKKQMKQIDMTQADLAKDLMPFYQTWVTNHKDDIFRYWVYKKIFTPYEMEQKFTDESLFEDELATFAKIEDVLPLTDGDLILGLRIIDDPDEDPCLMQFNHCHVVAYYRLSDISLEWFSTDNDPECDAEDNTTHLQESKDSQDAVKNYNWYDHKTSWDESQFEEDSGNDDEGGDDE